MLARLGRFVAHHAGVVVLLWAVATVAGFAAALGVVGEGLFARLSAGEPTVASESTDGRTILQSASTSGPAISLLVDGVAPTDPAVTEPVLAATADLAALVGVQSAASPVLPPGAPIDPEVAAQTAALTAADGNGFLVSVTLQPDLDGPTEDALLDATQARLTALGAEITAAVPSATTMVGGGTILFESITSQVEQDLVTGEIIALPVSLLVMVLVFGGFLAAGLPILGAIASIGGALAALLAFSFLIDLDASVVNVVTVLGLGLCIDYGLLIVSRYREELRRRLDEHPGRSTAVPREEALVATMVTAGRTVLFSGVTVAISLTGLLLFRGADPARHRRGRRQRRRGCPPGGADARARAHRVVPSAAHQARPAQPVAGVPAARGEARRRPA